MKKIGFLLLIILNIFYIYKVTIDNNIYYLSLGDYLALGIDSNNRINGGYNSYIKDYISSKKKLKKYNDYFIVNNYRTTDLINDITYNKEVNGMSIQNALIKADITSISIGNNDLVFDIQSDNDNLLDIINDLDNLFSLIRKYTKEEVIVNSFYYPFGVRVDSINDRIVLANEKLESLCGKYNFIYNDIYSLIEDNPNSIYPSTSEYKKIGKSIIDNSLLSRI